MTTTSKRRHTEATQPHWLEWVTGIIAALLVLAMIAWVAKEAILGEDTAPSFVVRQLSTVAVDGGHRVEFEITNRGTATAAAVVVRAQIVGAAGSADTAEVTFDYVPGNSTATGGVFFNQDPAGRDITLHAVGYTDP